MEPSDSDVLAMAVAAGCTGRQIGVLTELADGCSVAMIASLYEIHPRTVYKLRDRAITRIRAHQAKETRQ